MADTPATPQKEDDDVSKMVFLVELHCGETVRDAARTACVARCTAYRWRDDDAEFAEAWDDAIDAGTELMEREAIRRGMSGVTRPVFHKGKVCGHLQEYSDTLLIFMLKARRPDVYRERATFEHTGKGGKDLPATTTTVQAGVLVVPGVMQDPDAWTKLVKDNGQ
ncbi:terminase [Comamonadaceae bacterium G21597-S1]|nr:terminase [Comamonadaceae bacterium G21597-S1]